MATLPGLSSNSNTNTGLKPEVYTSSSSFVSGLAFLAPDNWKTKFPFDLVYPSSNPDTDIDEECPQFVLWGYEYQLCSIMQVARAAKSIFLVKLSIDFLMKG